MRRRPSTILFVGVVALAGCSAERKPFQIDVVAKPWVEAAAAEWQMSLFTRRSCERFTLADGAVDFARTATAAVRRTAATADGLGILELEGLDSTAALDVRAVDADDTPIAQRCIEVNAFVENGRFQVFALAPEGATFEVVENIALLAGGAKQPVQVLAKDASGAAQRGLFVSTGVGNALAVTGEDGIARIDTPTTTAPLDVALSIEVYGVSGPPVPGRAVVLANPVCPELSWTERLAGGGANLTSMAGDQDVVAVVLPESATRSRIEIYRAVGGRPALQRIATATTAGAGPVAIAEDRRDLSFIVAVGGEDANVYVHRFDPIARSLSDAVVYTASTARTGPLRELTVLSIASLTDDPFAGPSLIIGAPELRPTMLRFTPDVAGRFGAVEPLLDNADLLITDFAVANLFGSDAPELIITTANQLLVYDGATRTTPLSLDGITGRIAIGPVDTVLDEMTPDIVLAERSGNTATVRYLSASATGLAVASSAEIATAGERPFIDDLNGDMRPDVLVFSSRSAQASIVLGDGRGSLLGSAACPDIDDVVGGYAADLDRDGDREWVALIRDARELAVFARP